MEKKTRQFGPNLGVVPVTGSSISRFMRSWLRLTLWAFFLLSIYNQISHLLIFIVSKSTHVGIMQMRRRRLDRSQNQSILIKLPNFGARIFIHCVKHRRTFDLHRIIELDLTIIQMSLLFHSNKRCLFRVQWTLSKTREIDGSMH